MARKKANPEPAAAVAAEPTDEEFKSYRHKQRSPEQRRALIVRLNRIEGQVQGLRRMIEDDVYCPDVLVQVAATSAALDSFSRVMLDEHIRHCVKNDLIEGRDETIEELLHTLHKLIR